MTTSVTICQVKALDQNQNNPAEALNDEFQFAKPKENHKK